jgi:hypothetical protein
MSPSAHSPTQAKNVTELFYGRVTNMVDKLEENGCTEKKANIGANKNTNKFRVTGRCTG